MMLYPLTGASYPTSIRATGVALAGVAGRICIYELSASDAAELTR